MKIYFAGSIRGGRDCAKTYDELIIPFAKTFRHLIGSFLEGRRLSAR